MKEPIRVTYAELSDLDLPFKLAGTGDRFDPVVIELIDGSWSGSKAVACMQLLHWGPYLAWSLPIRMADVFEFKSMGRRGGCARFSLIYERLLDEFPDVNHTQLVESVWILANRLASFSFRFCSKFAQSVDIESMLAIYEHPVIQEITNRPIPQTGITDVEMHFRACADEIVAAIESPTTIADNPLRAMSQAGLIKAASIPQILHAYGTRADPSSRIMRHTVNTGALIGWQSAADMAVESLATRTTHYITRDTLPASQYFFRIMRLASASMERLYPGDCGNRIGTDPILLPEKWATNFIGCGIYDGPNTVWLDRKNLRNYVGRHVSLITPATCRHRNGCCEHCYGAGKGRAIRYRAPDYHLGTEAASELCGANTQTALGVKHRNSTSAIDFAITDGARKWLTVGPNVLFLRPDPMHDVRKMCVAIPLADMVPLNNLEFDIAREAASFSTVNELGFVYANDPVDVVSLAPEDEVAYLSSEFIRYLQDNLAKTSTDGEYLIVPLAKWNPKLPILQYTVVSDDITAFINRVTGFFRSTLADYTSYTEALQDVMTLLFAKMRIQVNYIQVLLRAHLFGPEGDPRIPIINDLRNVTFGTFRKAIYTRSDVLLLAYEDQIERLNDPSSYLNERIPVLLDGFLGVV